MIFYVAPQRLLATLKTFCEYFGNDRKAVVARELTKLYESIRSCYLSELFDYYTSATEEQRGEVVILISGVDKKSTQTKTSGNISRQNPNRFC